MHDIVCTLFNSINLVCIAFVCSLSITTVTVSEQEKPPADGDDCFCMKKANGPEVCTGRCSN